MADSFYLESMVEAFCSTADWFRFLWKEGAEMDAIQQTSATNPDERNFQVWEDMRLEILHDLQDGASEDVPDSLVDSIGFLVVDLQPWRTEKNKLKALPVGV